MKFAVFHVFYRTVLEIATYRHFFWQISTALEGNLFISIVTFKEKKNASSTTLDNFDSTFKSMFWLAKSLLEGWHAKWCNHIRHELAQLRQLFNARHGTN